MKKTSFTVLLFVFTTFIFAQQRGSKPLFIKIAKKQVKLYDQSHALIIGNDIYTNGWNNLQGVKTDVYEVKAALEKNGFNVILKQNLTKIQTDKAFSDFIKNYGAGENNRLLFYYAGHGYTVKSKYGGEVGYIVPSDAPNPNKDKAGFQSKAVEMSQIETYAKRIDSKHAIFLFDACFAGSIFAMRDAVPAVITYKTKEPVRQFITSGSANETVPDKSIFRQQFVIALTSKSADANKDGYLTGTELGKFLQDNVVNYSYNNQHPQYGKIRNQYLDKGDFVFILNSKQNNTDVNTTKIEEEDIAPLATYGNLQITNYLQGDLYIDGTYKQLANKNKKIIITDLPTGTYTIKIKTKNETWTKTVTIIQNQTTKVKAVSTIVATNITKPKDLPAYFTDSRDNKRYKIVEIGNQIWMAENLAYNVNSGCWAYDNKQSNVTKYGYLYNWETATGACPTGWHLPSDEEWTKLENQFGGSETAGIELKSTDGWNENINGNNSSGFNALSSGYRGFRDGSFRDINKYGGWWSSTPNGSKYAWGRYLYYGGGVYRYGNDRIGGFSVRCLKD